MGRVGKLILLLFVALVGWVLFKGLKAPAKRAQGKRSPQDRPVERMVVCEHCGVHLPESESLLVGERRFCSEEHRRLAG